ncbi:MAG TPA: glycosyltransferase family 2 protein [Planctomycetota bacterium]|nr:glycosyltransferase family 2 protein [Planctomycetota bacterium]
MHHVAVVIPAYRVANQIERVVRGLPDWVRTIVVVVDASPDDTAARVRALRAAGERRLTVIEHEVNRGVGGAMVTGLREALRAGAEIVVKMDGDDQMDPRYLPDMLAPLVEGRADITKGNRYSSFAAVRQMPGVRLAGNAVLTFLVKAATGYWTMFDPANGYVAVRRTVLELIELEQLPKRYFFECGFLIEAGLRRAVVQDVAIDAKYADEHSSLSVPRTALAFPPRLLKGFVRRVFWRYFVHDFSAASVFLLTGLPLLLFGVVYGTHLYLELNVLHVGFATAGQVMIAALPIALGFQLILQAVVLDIAGVPRMPISPRLPQTAQ